MDTSINISTFIEKQANAEQQTSSNPKPPLSTQPQPTTQEPPHSLQQHEEQGNDGSQVITFRTSMPGLTVNVDDGEDANTLMFLVKPGNGFQQKLSVKVGGQQGKGEEEEAGEGKGGEEVEKEKEVVEANVGDPK